MSALVLSRKVNQEIDMTLPNGEKIKVTVLQIQNSQVKLKFDAPSDVSILRDDAVVNHKKSVEQL